MADENDQKQQTPQVPIIDADEDPENAQWLRILGADHAQLTQQELRRKKRLKQNPSSQS